ncbi:chitobiase/beta-hexosaminidase C-terminal domain-containing protein [Asticcacaulis solisilvae]|uniref:chitobiase/beta-hexosaminidase C-terminal domain-containing protein n=1 Tax=Asticcacaulis solisilvae TaxID=1217274 RepID=UPI003FD812C4
MTISSRDLTAGALLASALALSACGGAGGGGSSGGLTSGAPSTPVSATPVISSTAALNTAVVVKLTSTDTGAVIYYTTDGTAPTTASQVYQAPFLVTSSLTVKAMAVTPGDTASAVQSQSISATIASNTLVWADEFNNSTGAAIAPDSNTWGYDTGNSGFGNHELENYCAWGATSGGCDTANPNAFVGTDGVLHIVARQPSAGVYTSARMKSQGKFSFQYGRLEFRARVPEAQGLWPAVWTLGNSIATVNWPASGEQDILERVNGPQTPDVNIGSVHGTGFTGTNLGTTYHFASGTTAADWHIYGMIWKPGSVAYYIDNPATPYVTYKTSDIAGFAGSVWPFDNGQSNFLLINMAIGGDWPGAPDGTTPFPSTMDVDYIRLYTN